MTALFPTDLSLTRVDQVGSLLRPDKLKEIFAKYGRGRASEGELRQAQDGSIREAIAKQEAHNLPVVTDGEFRRVNFMESFSVVSGLEQWQSGVKTLHQILARP